MKTRFLKSFTVQIKQRFGARLVVCAILVLFALTGVAQLKTSRRVTALQLGGAVEGSRVTIVSDSALNDYEAFRRGDRFYIKIPLADFVSTLPRLRADGFEDVQVQKVGDGLLVSFKLQVGATARVDQHGNRLDVVFSAANRSPYNNTVSRVENTQSSLDRGRDAAGPLPPGSLATSRDRFISEGVGNERPQSQSSQNPWVLTNPQNAASKNSRGGFNNQSNNPNGANAASSPAPVSSPGSLLTPGSSSVYSPLTSATPAVSPAARPVVSDARSGLSWRQRGALAMQWASRNRLATLLGALILLSLILYLLLALRNRKDKSVKAKQARTPKVQPKYSAGSQLNELSARSEPATQPEKKVAAQSGAASETTTAARAGSQSGLREQPSASASAAAANASPQSQWVLTKPTITTPTAIPDEQEEEREVFEL